jgi:hypothetical protein
MDNEFVKVEVLEDLTPEEGITINKGCVGFLKIANTPTGWPIFKTSDTGTTWDIAVEDYEMDVAFKKLED